MPAPSRARVQGGLLAALLGSASIAAVAWLTQQFGAPIALALLVAAWAASMMLLHPVLATGLTLFLLYVNFPAILTKQHGIPEAAAGVFVLLLGIPLLHRMGAARARPRADTTLYLMVAFLFVSAVSSLTAIDHQAAFMRLEVFFFEGVLLYWLVINAVPDLAALRRAIWTLLAAGALLSALSLYQDVTGSYSQEFGGLAYRNYAPEEEEAPTDRRSKWDRAQGPVNEPNRFAQVLIVLVPLAVFLFRTPRSRLLRASAAAAGSLIVIGILLTLSRGAIVTLAMMAAAMVTLKWLRPPHLTAAGAALVLALPLLSPYLLPRLQSLSAVGALIEGDTAAYRRQADGAMLGRTTAMLSALRVFLDHPALGVGPGQFSKFYVLEYSTDPDIKFRQLTTARRAHNLYLEIAAETGAVGLTVFLAIFAVLLRRLKEARRRVLTSHPELADLLAAFWLAIAAYLCTAMFLHLSYQRYLWLLLALAGAALSIASPPQVDAAAPRRRRQAAFAGGRA